MLTESKLVAIIRDVDAQYVTGIVQVLLREGIDTVEVSLSNPERGYACIEALQRAFSKDQLHLGVGTVVRRSEVDRVSELGADFILTPGYDDELVGYAQEKGMEILPGVFTPGEVQKALNRGVTLLKLFPADSLPMNYVSNLKGPFPQAEFVAVGGVTRDNFTDFLKHGFHGAAIGGGLVPRRATDADLPAIAENARAFVGALGKQAKE
ncbi:bifunctional 4-hydroxy-2-oxoglutarate aldolase/2-dehydro-3-deoxy-phosphogluconate aldolase [Caproiciproducens sp. R1]|uniref:bifunctional 4-hydroxy-2-oxoglutarate aldolase/2-dehydro-3-deoxy-phosphogluconate aldolase n=1 Tax=Caproiciproducens sp. R1 TaxID=3435000 RepID=UPI004033BABC